MPEPTSSSGFNRYRYARNNPLKYIDPSGHCVILAGLDTAACVAVGVAIAAAFGTSAYFATNPDAGKDLTVALSDMADSIPLNGPNIEPLPGYGAGELEFNDPLYQPGPTLGGEYAGPLHLPYPEQVQENSSIFDPFERPNGLLTTSAVTIKVVPLLNTSIIMASRLMTR